MMGLGWKRDENDDEWETKMRYKNEANSCLGWNWLRWRWRWWWDASPPTLPIAATTYACHVAIPNENGRLIAKWNGRTLLRAEPRQQKYLQDAYVRVCTKERKIGRTVSCWAQKESNSKGRLQGRVLRHGVTRFVVVICANVKLRKPNESA